MENIITLEYKEELRTDFTKNYLKIIYNKKTELFKEIYFYNYEYGIIEVKNGVKTVHRWENEEEAQSHSYLNRRYTVTFLDGKINDIGLEKQIINEILKYLETIFIKKEEKIILNKMLKYIRKLYSNTFPNKI
ncbi:hypothetical protein [Breznakiella homolactica]|uniref:Uncharacterized protein n=1 Tax=Breznakiella homolactica TaxID=2798577 RepID=A0A7T8BBA9_9SPIR|nr:hypothetical protein [Breznakiella homolactica]QQO10367.1 hypothetical protein JFL75_05465 [Breznakiella homolactica]